MMPRTQIPGTEMQSIVESYFDSLVGHDLGGEINESSQRCRSIILR